MKPWILLPALLAAAAGTAAAGDAKSGTGTPDKPDKDDQPKGICEWLEDEPGLLYESDDNPFIQRFELEGRLHYQAAYVAGKDVNGRRFHDTYDEFRRARLGAEVEFLRFLKSEISVNLVDDRRFRDNYPYQLDWGYDTFDTLTLELDLDKALDLEWLDKLELTYGRMKVAVGEEAHQSSREIFTIERSALSDRVGGEEGRPTGAMLAIGRGDWELTIGAFSGEDDADALGGWNDGYFYYGSLEWEPKKRWRFVYDQILNDPRGIDRALGYAWASSLSGVYQDDRWGVIVNGIYGDNGGIGEGNLRSRRQGDFWGYVVMPWYWIVEDRLQLVLSYQYQESEEAEGIRLDSRYVRARHDDPLIDVDNGRGDMSHSFYAGLNYHLCGDRAKIMAGVSHTKLHARTGEVRAMSYLIAFRSYF